MVRPGPNRPVVFPYSAVSVQQPVMVGDRIVVRKLEGRRLQGTVRFLGSTSFADGVFMGVECDEDIGGHDGSWKGKRYFECAAGRGLFCWPPKGGQNAASSSHTVVGDQQHKIHIKARSNERYDRTPVPDDKVLWQVEWLEYSPQDLTVDVVLRNDRSIKDNGWADPVDWYQSDEFAARLSFHAKVRDADGRPRNPVGRTGLRGRGQLGKWGANQAADPIVFRRAKDNLEVLLIKRHDNGDWAIPGGMVDDGELASVTLKREFAEEAANLEKQEDKDLLEEIFKPGKHQRSVYQGYVDDPRNTDNAWMETSATAIMLTQKQGELLRLEATEGETLAVQWISVDQLHAVPLFASHAEFLDKAVGLVEKRMMPPWLHVKVIEAVNISSDLSSMTPCDPLVKTHFQGELKESGVERDTTTPKWNWEHEHHNVQTAHGSIYTLQLLVYNKGMFGFNRIAHTFVDVSTFKSGEMVDTWVELYPYAETELDSIPEAKQPKMHVQFTLHDPRKQCSRAHAAFMVEVNKQVAQTRAKNTARIKQLRLADQADLATEEVELLEQAWKIMDHDKKGFMTHYQMRRFASDAEFRDMDLNQDGVVTIFEYVAEYRKAKAFDPSKHNAAYLRGTVRALQLAGPECVLL